jgi:membrane protease YdiL (CAAX protease family)
LNGPQKIRDWFQKNIIDTQQGPPLAWRPIIILASATVLLTLFYYYGKSGFYFRSGLDAPIRAALPDNLQTYADLLPYAWWGSMAIIMRVVIPCIIIRAIFKESPLDNGLGWGESSKHWPIYIGLLAFMLPCLLWASTLQSFQNNYPFYDRAAESWAHFILYECLYGFQFIGVEFFFRGFLIFALFRTFGWYALLISAVPYVMIHFNKPLPETLGALVAGTILGYLALRTRSIWPGVFVHGGVALTMDTLSLWQKSGG